MAGIGDYLAKFTANVSGFTKPLADAARETESLKKTVMSLDDAMGFKNPTAEAKKNLQALESNLKLAGVSAVKLGGLMLSAGTAVGGAMLFMAKSTANLGDNLRDASLRTGVSVEELSKLRFAAQQSGASFDDLTSGLRLLARNAVEAAEGSKAQTKAFGDLGIRVTETTGQVRPMGDVLLDVADKFKGMPDGAQKSAAAMELFGRGGAALIPLLNEGSASIKAMGVDLEELGGVFSTDAANAADEFNDAQTRLTTSITGLSMTIGNAIIPTLTKLTDAITPVIASVSDWVAAHPQLIELAGTLAVTIGGAGGLLAAVGALGLALPAMKIGFAALGIAGGPVFLAIGAIAALSAVIYTFRDEIASGLLKTLSLAVEGFAKFIDAAATISGALGLSGISGKLQAASKTVLGFSNHLTGMANTFDEATPVVIGNTSAVNQWIESQKEAPPVIRENTEEQKKFAKELESVRQSILGIKEPTKAWTMALHDLDSEGRLSTTAILGLKNEVMGLKDSKDPLILKLQQLIPLIASAKSNYEAQKEVVTGLAAATRDLSTIQLPTWMRSADPIITAPLIPPRWEEDLKADMDDAYDIMQGTHEAIRDEQKETADHARDQMKSAVDSVRSSAGEIFDAMFIKGENVFTSLKNLLKGGALSLGRSIFEDVTAQLLGPIKKAFDDFFMGLLESTGITNFLNGLGAKLGGMLGGVKVGGGTVPTGGGGGGGGIGGFLSNPWTIGIGAALGATALVLTKWVGTGRKTADKFVQEFQNPFNEAISDVHDTFYEAYRTGNLTVEEAKYAREQVTELWNTFKREAEAFGAQGETEAKVVRQAFATVSEVWGEDLGVIVGGFDDVIGILGVQEEATKDLGDAADDTSDAIKYTTDDLDDLGRSAHDALNPIRELAAALRDLEISARSPGSGGGTTSPTAAPTDRIDMAPPIAIDTGPDIRGAVNQVWGNTSPTSDLDPERMASIFRIFGNVPSFHEGGIVPRTGLAMVEKGEYITPAGGGSPAINFYIHTLDTADMRDIVEQRIAPELIRILDSGAGLRGTLQNRLGIVAPY